MAERIARDLTVCKLREHADRIQVDQQQARQKYEKELGLGDKLSRPD